MSCGILKISGLFPKPRQYVRKELSAESGSPDYFGLNVDMEVSDEIPLETTECPGLAGHGDPPKQNVGNRTLGALPGRAGLPPALSGAGPVCHGGGGGNLGQR